MKQEGMKQTHVKIVCVLAAFALCAAGLSPLATQPLRAQELAMPDGPLPTFYEYNPPTTLVVPQNPKTRSKFPFIDAHAHQYGMADQDLTELVAEMDKLNMGVMVNLSGRGFRRTQNADGTTSFGIGDSENLKKVIANARANAPGRFGVFTNVNFSGIGESGWTERAVRELEADVQSGAQGLKVYKGLGMDTRDSSGERVAINDKRLDPIWAKCGELGIPVLIHSAEPASFWKPKDGQNERLFELMERPRRYRDPATNPSWEQIISEQHDIFRKHPGTTFINAHLGWLGGDLASLGRLFDEMPNVHTEIGAVLAELGRQPRTARAFFIRYQDRILFGKDSWAPKEYQVYFRVLETADEYFDYYRRRHGHWKIYGLDLPDDVLKKVYYKNALRIIPGLDGAAFPD